VITSGQLNIPPNNVVSGAIHSIAPHPFDPNMLYVGTTNGGVWRNSDRTVFFEFDSDDLTPAAQAILTQYATFLLQNPGVAVQVRGHTDSVGDATFTGPSADRANAVNFRRPGVPARS
jgi:outer membrane protein OmpA-like peptidoglycan-associated protein